MAPALIPAAALAFGLAPALAVPPAPVVAPALAVAATLAPALAPAPPPPKLGLNGRDNFGRIGPKAFLLIGGGG